MAFLGYALILFSLWIILVTIRDAVSPMKRKGFHNPSQGGDPRQNGDSSL